MIKKQALVLIFALIFSLCFSAAFAEYKEGGENYCPPFDPSVIAEGTDIDSLTTTAINPWMKLFHITTPEQIQAGYAGGECGQKMYSLAASTKNPDLVLLGTDTESVWRSEDGGLSWTPSDSGLEVMGTNYLCFSPDDENVAFVTSFVNESTAKMTDVTGIYKTTDGGKSWRMVLNVEFLRMPPTCLIKYSKLKNGKRDIYSAGNLGGVFKSSDDGETWVNIGLTDMYINSINVIDDYVLAFTKDKGIMATVDDGQTWTELNNGIDEVDSKFAEADPANPSRWFAITAAKLYESNDYGNSWKANCTAQDMGYPEGKQLFKLQIGPKRANGSARMYVSSSSVQYPMRYSDDYGKTFKKSVVDNTLATIKDNWGYSAEPFFVHPVDPDLFWISLDGQMMKSTDGGATLFPASSGYSGMRASNFYFDLNGNENDFYITCIDRSSIRSAYTGQGEDYPLMYYMPCEDRYKNVRAVGAKTVHSLAIDPKNPNRVVHNIGTWGGTGNDIKDSLDGGLNWNNLKGSTGCTSKFMSFNPDNPNTIYAGNFISYDDGATWVNPEYKLIGMSPFNGNTVYAFANSTVYKSVDEGRTWTTLCAGLPSGTQRVTVDKFQPDKLYIGTVSSGVCVVEGDKFRMLDSKNGFISVKGRTPVYTVAQNPKNEKHLVAGGVYASYNYRTAGLFESLDGGETWRNIPGVLNSADIWIIEFRESKKQVWVGTSGGSYVYEYEKFVDMNNKPYLDTASSYAEEDILKLYDEGVYDKLGDGKFNPQQPVTRGEFSKQIKRLFDLKRTSKTSPYTDIVSDDIRNGGYLFPYVQSLFDNGLLMLSEDGKFNPENPLTYDEMVIIGSRLLSKFHIQDEFGLEEINEHSELPAYVRYAYHRCFAKGILDDKISFETGKNASNEDAAHFILKLKEVLAH